MLKTYTHRKLPHITPPGETFFITTRLNGTLPKHLIAKWQEEKKRNIEEIRKEFKTQKDWTGKQNYEQIELLKKHIHNIHKRYFKKVDDYLDQAQNGPTWLKDPEVAQRVIKKLHQYDKVHYDLIAFVIMSNHLHVLVDTSIQLKNLTPGELPNIDNYTQVGKFMGLIKGGSSFEANQILGRKGRFWSPESYDHLVRSFREYVNIIRYILNNPVKAKLVKMWKDWEFSYVQPGLEDLM